MPRIEEKKGRRPEAGGRAPCRTTATETKGRRHPLDMADIYDAMADRAEAQLRGGTGP